MIKSLGCPKKYPFWLDSGFLLKRVHLNEWTNGPVQEIDYKIHLETKFCSGVFAFLWTLQSTTCYVTRALVHLEKLAHNRQVHNSNGWFSVQSKMKKTIRKWSLEMACHFVSIVLVLLAVLAVRGSLGHGTPQPEQIHISSTGGWNDYNLAHCSLDSLLDWALYCHRINTTTFDRRTTTKYLTAILLFVYFFEITMVSSFGRSLLADLIWRRLFQDGGHVEIIIIYIYIFFFA